MHKCGVACLLIAMVAARPAVLCLAPVAGVNNGTGVHAACAAFASDGGSVAASVDGATLSADVTDAAGHVSRLTLPFDDSSTRYQRIHAQYHTCSVYFDRDSDLIAVGMTYGLPTYYVYVAVADATHLKWIGHWTVGPESGVFIPRLAGFLGKNLLVGGEPFTRMNPGVAIRSGSFVSLVFDPHARQLDHGRTERTYAPAASGYPLYVDPEHNRLWFFPGVVDSPRFSHLPDHPVSWIALTGDTSSSQVTPRTPGDRRMASWLWPGAFVAPNADTIAVAEEKRIWVVHVREQTWDRIDLPGRSFFPHSKGIVGASALSPDGRIAAFRLVKRHVPFPYLLHDWVYSGTDFAVVDLQRLQLLRIVRGAGPTSVVSCAVDHRQDRVALLLFREGGWEHLQLN